MRVLRVALLLNLSYAAGRMILRGATSHARSSDRWVCQVHLATPECFEPLRQWKPAGAIVEPWDQAWADKVRATGIPVVEVGTGWIARPEPSDPLALRVAHATIDDHAVGVMAASYFAERGYKSCAFVGMQRSTAEMGREAGFHATVTASGATCVSYFLDDHGTAADPWGTAHKRLRHWLRSLPKPVGILAANDGRGMQLMEAARQAGLEIPDDIAVVGIDNDDLLCETANPSLSSVAPPWERVGYEAAVILDAMMAGGVAPPDVKLRPARVVTRRSSDTTAIHDVGLAAAVRYVRQNASRQMSVGDVVRHVAMSRRALERRFRQSIGHTVLEEIHRAHVESAKQLLIQTDLTMRDIAERAGFHDDRRLSETFRTVAGMSPSAFRRQYRLRV